MTDRIAAIAVTQPRAANTPKSKFPTRAKSGASTTEPGHWPTPGPTAAQMARSPQP